MLIEIAPFSPDFPNFQRLNEQAADMTKLLHNELVQKHEVSIEDADQSIVITFLNPKSVGRNLNRTIKFLDNLTERLNQSFFSLEFSNRVIGQEGGVNSNEVTIFFSVKK